MKLMLRSCALLVLATASMSLCSAAVARGGPILKGYDFSWQGAPVAGAPDAQVTYTAGIFVAPTWRRLNSSVDQLRFHTGTNGGHGRCQLTVVARASFFIGPDEDAGKLLATQYPVADRLVLSHGTRDLAAWRTWKQPPALGRTRLIGVWQQPISAPTATQTVWGRVTLRATSTPGHGLCTTHYYRDGALRHELADAMSTVTLSASY